MNSYLKLAENILSKSKQPLTAAEILEAAYRMQLVPPHLFGKTQHKTLQARLSEDILYNKSRTLFTRTGPGRFALRKYAESEDELSRRYIAPLRSYQLKRFEVVCAELNSLHDRASGQLVPYKLGYVADLFQHKMPLLAAERNQSFIPIHLLVTLHHADLVLSFSGEADADHQRSRRALGLFGYLKASDSDLFSSDFLGVDNAARRIVSEQTRMPIRAIETLVQIRDFRSLTFTNLPNGSSKGIALVISAYECVDPDQILEWVPSNRLPRWTRALSGINDLNTLDNISRQLLSAAQLQASILYPRRR